MLGEAFDTLTSQKFCYTLCRKQCRWAAAC